MEKNENYLQIFFANKYQLVAFCNWFKREGFDLFMSSKENIELIDGGMDATERNTDSAPTKADSVDEFTNAQIDIS